MGDGRVALILDVFGLARWAGAVSEQQGWAAAEGRAAAGAPRERPIVLIVEGHNGERRAIPLAQVARLEEFPRAALERVAGRPVVQYGGQILPLLDVEALLGCGGAAAGDSEAVQVVVCARREHPVGLVVGRILDIVEQDSDVRGPSSRPGVERTAVIQGRVTELLDVEVLVGAGAGG